MAPRTAPRTVLVKPPISPAADEKVCVAFNAIRPARGRLYVFAICEPDGTVYREIYLQGQTEQLMLMRRLNECGFQYQPAHVQDKYSVKLLRVE